jgi:hypothetical protein
MIVYHGSKVVVKPDVNQSYRPLDFGKGFYVTTALEKIYQGQNGIQYLDYKVLAQILMEKEICKV